VSTVNLLTIASEIGCHRIILTGSLDEPESDGGETVPCSPYAAAK
jgi:UDP-glucose 4-epimerase